MAGPAVLLPGAHQAITLGESSPMEYLASASLAPLLMIVIPVIGGAGSDSSYATPKKNRTRMRPVENYRSAVSQLELLLTNFY